MSVWGKVGITCSAIGSFIAVSLLFYYIFDIFETDSTVSSVMSVISGLVVVWIILSVSGILKEFSIKGGPFFELKSKMNDIEKETRDSNKEICGKINNLNQNFLNSLQSLNNRIDTVVTNISSSSAKSETNFTIYSQNKEELNKKLNESGIPLQIDPKKVVSRAEIEKIDLLMNKVKTLEETLDRKVTLTPPEMLSRANYYYYKNKFDNAMDMYKEILKEDKNNYTALFNLAHCYSKIGKYSLALENYKNANQIQETTVTLYNIGSVYGKLVDFQNAKNYYNKCLEKDPKFYDAILALGDIAKDENDFSLAKEKYEYVLNLESNNLSALERLTVFYQHNHDLVNAKKYAGKVIEIKPENVTQKIAIGIAHIVLGKLTEALEIFNEILIKDPNDTGALYNKACIMSLRNQIDESLELLKKTVKLDASFKLSFDMDPDLENVRKDPRFQNI